MRSRILFDALVQDLRQITVPNGYPISLEQVYTNSVDPALRVYPSAEVTGGSGNEQPLDIGDRHTDATDSFVVRLWASGQTPDEDLLDLKDAVRTAVRRGSLSNLAVAFTLSWEPAADLDETVLTGPRSFLVTVEFTGDFTVDGG